MRMERLGIKRQLRRDAAIGDARDGRRRQRRRRNGEQLGERKPCLVRQNRLRSPRRAQRHGRQRHQDARPDIGFEVSGRVVQHQQRPTRKGELDQQLVHAHHPAALFPRGGISDPALGRREHHRRGGALRQPQHRPAHGMEDQRHGEDAGAIDRGGRGVGADVANGPHCVGREPRAQHVAGVEHRPDQADAERTGAHMVQRQRRGDVEDAGGALQQHDRKDQRRDVAIESHEAKRPRSEGAAVDTMLRGAGRLNSCYRCVRLRERHADHVPWKPSGHE